MLRGHLDESFFIDPLGRDVDPDRDRAVPEGASLFVRGWAFFTDPERPAASVSAAVDGGARFALAYNQDRPDVAGTLGLARTRVIGFHGVVPLGGLARGPHAVRFEATDERTGAAHAIGEPLTFETVAGSYAFAPAKLLTGTMAMTFDYLFDPESGVPPHERAPLEIERGRTAVATGWAIDLVHRTAVSDVYACIDGDRIVRGIVGLKRDDAARSVGVEEAWRCGYIVRIPTADFERGRHAVTVRAVSADGHGYEVSPEIALEIR
jgi:hypothetical protein